MNSISYEEHKGFIKKVVHSWICKTSRHLYKDFEEWHSEAVIGFLTSSPKYDGEGNLRAFLRKSISNHLTDKLRTEIRYHQIRKLLKENPQSYEETNDLDVTYEQSEMMNVSRHHDSCESEVYNEGVFDLMSKCEEVLPSDYEIVGSYLDNRGSMRDAALSLGMPERTYWRKMSVLKDKLSKFVE